MSVPIQIGEESQRYSNVGNVRVTLVRKVGWAGPEMMNYLRVQGDRADDASQLFHGAELPLRDRLSGYRLVAALAALIAERFDDPTSETP